VVIRKNTFKPDKGDSLSVGVIVYNSVKPTVTDNSFYDPKNYVIDNTLSTDLVCEDNTYYRSRAGAATAFYVNTSVSNRAKATNKNVLHNALTKRSYSVDPVGRPSEIPGSKK
jgi:hypothetical protein